MKNHRFVNGLLAPIMFVTFCVDSARTVAESTTKATKTLAKESARLAQNGRPFAAAVLGLTAAQLGQTAVAATDSITYAAAETQQGVRDEARNGLLSKYLVACANACKKFANFDIFGEDGHAVKLDPNQAPGCPSQDNGVEIRDIPDGPGCQNCPVAKDEPAKDKPAGEVKQPS
jgi:hypothetical protein